jgi:polyketide cyclase/dehydrase/lipid transport protein
MKALKIIGIVFLVIVVLIFVVSLFLPSQTHVERSIVINASSEKVFKEVNTFSNLLEWSPWAQIDPENTNWNFSGPENGVGAKYNWTSENPDVGVGSQEIIESKPNELVKTQMVFADMEGGQFASFILVPEGEGTKLTWTYDGEMNGVMNKYVGAFFMDMILGPFYEKGVNSLKVLIEERPDPKSAPEVVETDSLGVDESI